MNDYPLGGTDFLYSFGNFGIRPGLANMETMLAKLDNPHRGLRIVHFAGTNGKGSTLTVTEQLLLASGYSVGATTSPHLVKLNERFRLNGRDIDDPTLGALLGNVYAVCGITEKNTGNPERWALRPTFFEMMIVVAFMWFQENKVDLVLLETGMGGRLDATNVADGVLQIITGISYDHEHYLGNTLEKIAREKAGIIKSGQTVIVGKQQPNIAEQLRAEANRKRATCYEFNRHTSYDILNNQKIRYTLNTPKFRQEILVDSPALKGRHQLDNLAVALLAYHLMADAGKRLSDDRLNDVLQRTRFKGRLDEISKTPLVLCDGAHNPAGMSALLSYVRERFSGKKITVALTRMNDKRIESAFGDYLDLEIVFQPLTITYARALSGAEMAKALADIGKPINAPLTVSAFVKKLTAARWNKCTHQNEVTIVCGSLYLLGEFYDAFEAEKLHPRPESRSFQNTNV